MSHALYLGIVLLLTSAALAQEQPGQAVYDQFNAFAAGHFGAAHEPLVRETYGDTLKLRDAATWSHVSPGAAVLAFATNLPATSHVEFGQGAAFDRRSDATERPFYLHIHHLAGLEPGQTYRYRFVAVDEADNRAVLAEGELVPQRPTEAIAIPGDMGGPPYNLTQADATYVLEADIVAGATAINIMAAGITVDLNGHTVTYDDDAGAELGPEAGFGHFGELNPHAIRSSYGGRGARIYNGHLRQGSGQRGLGSQPIYSNGMEEIAGLTVTYAGSQLTGIHRGDHVHHNIVADHGTELTDRHAGIAAINAAQRVEYNLVKRARQRGITGVSNGQIRGNEIYIDSYATNSFGVMFYKQDNAVCADNRIFGTGYHALGVGTVSAGVKDIRVHDNLIHLQAVSPTSRSSEYGEQSQVECVRVTWGGENIQYHDNVLVARAQPGGEASGIWHYSQATGQRDVVYRDNVVKVLRDEDRPSDKLEGAIRICGNRDDGHVPVLLENNRVISNFLNVRLGDRYGVGSNARFVANTFVREDDHEHFVTVQVGHHNHTSTGHVFERSRFENGAGFDRVRWVGSGERDFTVIDDAGQSRRYTP